MDKNIKVTGRAKLSVRPDRIRLLMDLTGDKGQYSEAISESSEKVNALKIALQPLGFGEEELKTVSFSIDTFYENVQAGNNWKREFKGYKYIHSLKLEFDLDNEKLGKVIYALSNSKSVPEFRICYTVKDTENAKKELLKKAVMDSKEKAFVLSEAAGVKLGDIVNIDYSWGEMDIVVSPLNRMRAVKVASEATVASYSMDMEPEDIDITDTVTVIWSIE